MEDSYEINLNNPLNGLRYGINFTNGVGETSNQYLISKLSKKGFKVTRLDSGKKGEIKEVEEMTTTELKEYAKINSIDIKGLTAKNDILTAVLDFQSN